MIAELVTMFGAKACCIGAAGTGGICNAVVRRKTPVRDILISVLVVLFLHLFTSTSFLGHTYVG